MHLETSISLATEPVMGSRMPGGGVVVAERRLMSRDCMDMSVLLSLLDLDQDALRFRRLRVAVTDGVGQRIGDVAGLGRTEETPVDRHAHLVHGAAIDLQGLDALGHHRHRFDVAALGTDPHAAAVVDAQFVGQCRADLDELLGLDDGVELAVLGPEVEMLGQAVGGGHMRELVRRTRS
ncbi:hypothetical protein G6F31_017063 [Rhizopus arrhizus]|nr:hypothetical protein G6F31_017063 [Rhizopus arrhizus]